LKTHIHPDHERRGSILLLVVITMSMLSLFAIGATENSRTLIRTASVDRDVLEARLGAESAIEYANQRLYRDNDWNGSADWIDLGNGVEYRAIRHTGTIVPGMPAFSVEARSGEATVMLEAQFEIGVNNTPFLDDAIAFLGGSADFNAVQTNGDLMIVDTESGVMDYNPSTDTWEVRSSGGDPVILSNNNQIDGNLSNYTGGSGGLTVTGDVNTLDVPLANPTWNLDHFLVPGPGIEIVTNKFRFRNYTTNNTLVIVADPGQHIDFIKCNIKGGVIIWSPEDWPQRGAPRNTVDFSSSTFGNSTGTFGAYQKIGMLAPSTELRHGNTLANDGHGLFQYHSINHLNSMTINGALWVTNNVDQMNSGSVTWDPDIGNTFFQGLKAGPKPVEVLSVSEFHPSNSGGTGGQVMGN
jgi:hypothetical protein